MLSDKQLDRADQELIEGLRAADSQAINQTDRRRCSMPFDLDRFECGKCDRHAASLIMAHVGRCADCAEYLGDLRHKRTVRRRKMFALATAAACLVAIFLMFSFHHPAPDGLAVIDLRDLAPTRGQSPSNLSSVVIPRNTAYLRIVLAIGSEGHYQCRFTRKGETGFEVVSSGEAIVQDGKVVLPIAVNFHKWPAGDYILGLRRADSLRTEYPITLK